MSITLAELEAAASRLPSSGAPRGRFYKVPVSRPVEPICRYRPVTEAFDLQYSVIEFEARPTKVHGHDAVAWYWHELLVRVTV